MNALIPMGLVILMLLVGLQIDLTGWRDARRGRWLAVGVALQVLALPALALAIGVALGLPTTARAGLVLIAAAPGGVSSNYLALLLGGDLALSVAMTLSTSLIAGVTLPLVLVLAGLDLAGTGGLWQLALRTWALTAVPLVIGLSLTRWRPSLARGLLRRLDLPAKAAFLAMVAVTVVQNAGALTEALPRLIAAVVALNLAALVLGWTVPRALGAGAAPARTIMVELSLQNIAVALFVALGALGRADLAAPALIYAVVMNLTALALIGARRRGAVLPA